MELGIELMWINHPTAPRGHAQQPHSHSCCQLYYVEQGEFAPVVGQQRISAGRGCCFLIPPFVQHHTLPAPQTAHLYELKLLIHDPFLNRQLSLQPDAAYSIQDDGHLQPVFAYIHENWLSKDPQNMRNINSILNYLLLRFFIRELHYDSSTSHFVDTRSYCTATCRVLHYVEHHFAQPVSLDALSQALSYNKSYLCKSFHQDTGYTIVDYLRFVRIRQAVIHFVFYADDLASGRECSGLSVPGNFSRTFKALVGITPRQFRSVVVSRPHEELHRLLSGEPIITYRICSMEEAFRSLRSIGQIVSGLKDGCTGRDCAPADAAEEG